MPSLLVVEDLKVLEGGVGELQADSPAVQVAQLDLHAGPVNNSARTFVPCAYVRLTSARLTLTVDALTPLLHHFAPLFEEVGTLVGAFNAPDRMAEAHLGHFAGDALFVAPAD